MPIAFGIFAIIVTIAIAVLFVKVVSRNAYNWKPDVNYKVGSVGDVITHIPNNNKAW